MATYSPSKITKDGNTYNFTDDTKIPLAGTSALAGSIVPSMDNTYNLGDTTHAFQNIHVGTRIQYNGTALYFTSANNDKAGIVLGYGALLPSKDSVYSLGSSTFKLKEAVFSGTVYCQTVVQTSDYRLKDEIESISDDVLNAWENLEPKQYKYKSDLETDKENAQVHYGWIAQDVESIIKGDRKGEVKNGLWLHEEWEEQKEVSHEEKYTEEVETEDGKTKTVTKTRKVVDTPYRAKGDSYGLRYTECLVVECAYLRKKLKELTDRIEQLEKGNNVK